MHLQAMQVGVSRSHAMQAAFQHGQEQQQREFLASLRPELQMQVSCS